MSVRHIYLAAVCVVLPACAHAPFAMAQEHSLSAEPLGLADQICKQVMGLNPGEFYFAMCHESLSQQPLAPDQIRALSASYDSCQQRALGPGTAAFLTCMGNGAAVGPTFAKISFGDVIGDTQAGRSFYNVGPAVRWNRERYGCAALGLAPGSAPFDQCMRALDGAFLRQKN